MVVRTQNAEQIVDQNRLIDSLLSISESPNDDFNFFLERWMSGTCEWILCNEVFSAWFQEFATPGVLWLYGLPASGKSIMSAYLINHLKQNGAVCQFFFFRFGDQTKRSLNALLRSLAFQIAEQVPEFRLALLSMSTNGVRCEKSDARTIWQKLFVSVLFKLNLAKPLYWVLDAIDESDSSKSLLELLSKLCSSRAPVRVIVISRRNVNLSSAFTRLASSVSLDQLSIDSNLQDIHLYVHNEMQYMHGSLEFRDYVIRKILERVEGNFLWVHLAIKEILQCHTQDDIERVLKDLPPGMEPLYSRMQANIVRNNKSGDIELAKHILSWVICSRRPLTIEELSEALKPEISAILDLKHTISQACGQFIVIDGKGSISMIHQTAKEYLTKTPNLRCGVDMIVSHGMIFAKCMQTLREPRLRGMLEHSTLPKLIAYGATSWPYHLNLSYAGSGHSLTLLTEFLRDTAVLTWIQYLSTFRQLKNLAFASQALGIFVQKRRRVDSGRSPLLHRLADLDTLELWAIDLAKILGKFGVTLLEDPESIFKLVPHFCPSSSAVYRQFGKEMTNTDFAVSGVSIITWDDCLARLFIGNNIQAEKIVASDRYFAVLGSNGIIVVWDAISFEEKHRLLHQEHVSTICFSQNGDMLISCGFRSTKIWKLSTCRLLHSIPNSSDARALDVTFALDDTIVMMGLDDRSVRKLRLGEISEGWQSLDPRLLREDSVLDGTNRNAPCCIAFNNDATRIAVAYRGFPLSVWSIEKPRIINRCRRTTNQGRRPSNAWTGVDRMTWHPIYEEILGLYSDGYIFKWQPLHDDNQELRARACEIACSPEGTLFAASDADGTVKIYNYQHFVLIYQLTWENLVVDLAFSPDCRRFYDIRGSICNIWEPNVLIRLSDTDERGSDTASEAGSMTLASMASETYVDMPSPIMALAPSDRDFHSAGNDDGIVHLFDRVNGTKTELWHSTNHMAVQHLEWSLDATKIAYAEFGGKICVRKVVPLASDAKIPNWTTDLVFDTRIQVESGGINQILLDPMLQYLLITSQISTQVWLLERNSLAASIVSKTPGVSQRWMNHPLFKDKLIASNSHSMTVYQWNDLAEVSMFGIDTAIASGLGEIDERDYRGFTIPPSSSSVLSPFDVAISIDRFMVTQDKAHIMMQSSEQTKNHKRIKNLCIFDIDSFQDSGQQPPRVLQPIYIPPEIRSRIEIPLGILPRSRLVFLDCNYWLCTWRISNEPTIAAPTKQFFLPKDWISPEALSMCAVTVSGVFLYPRNGEVAFIECGLGSPELLQS